MAENFSMLAIFVNFSATDVVVCVQMISQMSHQSVEQEVVL